MLRDRKGTQSGQGRRYFGGMNSLATVICAAVGALGVLTVVLLSTLRINQNRKARDRSRRVAARILNWKSPD